MAAEHSTPGGEHPLDDAPVGASGGAPDHPLDNAVWAALTTEHRGWAEGVGRARRYPTDVCVFAGVDRLDAGGWDALASLVGPAGTAALFRGEVPTPPPGWSDLHRGVGRQMWTSATTLVEPPPPHPPAGALLRRLTVADAGEALALVALTEPGPFAERTVEMGRYWGWFGPGDVLLALAGERLHLAGHTEISAVCTHPDVRGRGLAAHLTHRVARGILERGEVPFLHVVATNDAARRVYERLGFTQRRLVAFALVQAPPPSE